MVRFIMMVRQISAPYVILFFSLFVFIVFSLPRLQDPIAQDELCWLVAAKTLITSGTPLSYSGPDTVAAWSPHLYLYSIVAMFLAFGQSEAIARIPGLLFIFVSIVMIFFVLKTLAKGSREERLQWAAWMTLLYATTPAIIQGAAIIDIDVTLLIPLTFLSCWFFYRYQQTENISWAALTGIAMCLSLWTKVTTPAMIAILMVIYVFFPQKSYRHKFTLVGTIAIGILLFSGSWYLYCLWTDLPFEKPFVYAFQAFFAKSVIYNTAAIAQFFQNVLFFILWVGLLPLLLVMVLATKRCLTFIKDQHHRPEDIFLLVGFMLVAGYTFIGGISFGFPKYQSPGLSLVLVFLGITASQMKIDILDIRLGRVISIVLITAFLQILLVGDLIYQMKYLLREAMAYNPPSYKMMLRDIIIKLFLLLTIYAFIFISGKYYARVKSSLLLMLFIAIGSNLGLSLIQSTASYHTGYNYGGKGTIQTVDYIRHMTPKDGIVIAPSEIIYYLNSPSSPYLLDQVWSNKEALVKKLSEQKTTALTYSIATNTVNQVQMITSSPTIRDVLNRDYNHRMIGGYQVWTKKE